MRALPSPADLLGMLAEKRGEILGFVRDLVSVPTENPPGTRYRDCAELIRSKLATLGLDSRVVDAGPPDAGGERRYSLLSSYGRGAKALYFHGHYDVVPASRDGQFEPALDGDSLVGRGSSDMKGGLAAMLYAVWALKTADVSLDGRIGLVFVPDEETGGRLGSRHLSDAGLLAADGLGMLTPEPTSGVVWHANRGAITLAVTVKGRSAHVGLQHQGINAFERMVALASRLIDLKKSVEVRQTHFTVQPPAAGASVLLIGGRVEGGTNFNVVPGECRFTVDRRINPEEDFDTEKRRLLEVLEAARHDGTELEVEVLQEGRSAASPADGPLARALASSVQEVTGREPAFEMCPGLLETRFYAERGIPAFAYGPGVLAVSHGPHEFVKVRRIVDCAAVYALTATKLLDPDRTKLL